MVVKFCFKLHNTEKNWREWVEVKYKTMVNVQVRWVKQKLLWVCGPNVAG